MLESRASVARIRDRRPVKDARFVFMVVYS
jgi:hypothetical protein